MKIVVFADSHSDIDTMNIVVKAENPDLVIHLGDHLNDGIELQGLYDHIPMVLLKGNTDISDAYPSERLFSLDGKTAFIAHGDLYRVEEGLEDIINQGKCDGADIVLFGHTHKPYLSNQDGVWVMNPGRIGRKSSKLINATFGMIVLENGTISCRIVEFNSI